MMPTGSTFSQLQFGLLVNTVIPAGFASFCFYMGGFDYVKKMTEVRRQRAEALDKAKEIPSIANQLG